MLDRYVITAREKISFLSMVNKLKKQQKANIWQEK